MIRKCQCAACRRERRNTYLQIAGIALALALVCGLVAVMAHAFL